MSGRIRMVKWTRELMKNYKPPTPKQLERLKIREQKTHDIIKSLYNSGMGYRRIASHLNEQGIKTPKGNLWGNNNVHSILKRNKQRLHRQEIQKQDSEVEYGKMELVWLRDDELWKNPRKKLIQYQQ